MIFLSCSISPCLFCVCRLATVTLAPLVIHVNCSVRQLSERLGSHRAKYRFNFLPTSRSHKRKQVAEKNFNLLASVKIPSVVEFMMRLFPLWARNRTTSDGLHSLKYVKIIHVATHPERKILNPRRTRFLSLEEAPLTFEQASKPSNVMFFVHGKIVPSMHSDGNSNWVDIAGYAKCGSLCE